jgi:hypothetical protein
MVPVNVRVVDGRVRGVDDDAVPVVPSAGVVAVGVSGNCCVRVGGAGPVAALAVDVKAATPSAITQMPIPITRTGLVTRVKLHRGALTGSERQTSDRGPTPLRTRATSAG